MSFALILKPVTKLLTTVVRYVIILVDERTAHPRTTRKEKETMAITNVHIETTLEHYASELDMSTFTQLKKLASEQYLIVKGRASKANYIQAFVTRRKNQLKVQQDNELHEEAKAEAQRRCIAEQKMIRVIRTDETWYVGTYEDFKVEHPDEGCIVHYTYHPEDYAQEAPMSEREAKVEACESGITIGSIVVWAGENRDERDRLYPASEKSRLTVFRIGNSKTSFDYGVRALDGNEFYVKSHEIEPAPQDPVVAIVEASPEAPPSAEQEGYTTAQFAQAIDEAYNAYVTLYNCNASLEDQQAQFEVYQHLKEAYEAQEPKVVLDQMDKPYKFWLYHTECWDKLLAGQKSSLLSSALSTKPFPRNNGHVRLVPISLIAIGATCYECDKLFREKETIQAHFRLFFEAVAEYVNEYVLEPDDMVVRGACGHRYIAKFLGKDELGMQLLTACPECADFEQACEDEYQEEQQKPTREEVVA